MSEGTAEPNIDDDGWIRSSGCKNCIEVKDGEGEFADDFVFVRDSRHPDRVIPVLRDEFRSFAAGIKRGEFDRF